MNERVRERMKRKKGRKREREKGVGNVKINKWLNNEVSKRKRKSKTCDV